MVMPFSEKVGRKHVVINKNDNYEQFEHSTLSEIPGITLEHFIDSSSIELSS